MGHQRLTSLPTTRRWQALVAAVQNGDSPAEVARVVLQTIRANLTGVGHDRTVVESLWLLLRLPHAAQADCFPAALHELGVRVDTPPGLFDLLAAVSDALDASLPGRRGRTDVGEIAQLTLVETLTTVLEPASQSLVEFDPLDLQHHLAQLATVKHWGRLGRVYFARFFVRTVGSMITRTIPDTFGPDERFRSLADYANYCDSIEAHCHAMAVAVEQFTGEWVGKQHWLTDAAVERDQVERYASWGFEKMIAMFDHTDARARRHASPPTEMAG